MAKIIIGGCFDASPDENNTDTGEGVETVTSIACTGIKHVRIVL